MNQSNLRVQRCFAYESNLLFLRLLFLGLGWERDFSLAKLTCTTPLEYTTGEREHIRCNTLWYPLSPQEERWGLFDVSGQTVLLFLLWPFVAQGLVYLLRRAQRRGRISS